MCPAEPKPGLPAPEMAVRQLDSSHNSPMDLWNFSATETRKHRRCYARLNPDSIIWERATGRGGGPVVGEVDL